MVRVRYAPSPTGYQHIGGIRTALFNYLFARANDGRFILRIEDTDRERYQADALEDIYRTFDWLSFHWDEGPDVEGPHGPYLQSERLPLYHKYAARLVETGHAYPCFCSEERLERLRRQQTAAKAPIGYDRHCRGLSEAQVDRLRSQKLTPVIRFKIPDEGTTSFQDELLGTIEQANRDIPPDPVLLKSDGYPTYHLANVVDDHLMKITHILRAQEWLASGALHVLLYRAFGWEPPKYCHLPMVLGPDGQKLSKRHGATRVVEFREKGYLPEAIINYVALLGWSFDASREFFSLRELEGLFTLEGLNKAPAVFDYKKLDWFNGMYIRKTPPERLKEMLLPFLQKEGLVSAEKPSPEEERLAAGLVPLVQERLAVLADVGPMVRYLFREPEPGDPGELVPKKLDAARTVQILKKLKGALKEFADRSAEENEALMRRLAEELEVKMGDLLMPLRVAVTGSRVSPPLFESIRLLGTAETLRRVDRAMKALEQLRKGR
jgi:glutamyl-tRNA synthetase